MDSQDPQQNKKTSNYGRRPLWQWVLIYIIVAIILYGLIYLIFIRDSGGGGGGIY